MEPFRALQAVTLPMPRPNIDTDQIIPARFLRKPRSEGLGRYLFHDLRFSADGAERPDFPLNISPYCAARIVVAGRNFGCGSSREHAVWALHDYGFRAVIAPSLGDIFAGNCLKNGVLAIVLPAEPVAEILERSIAKPGTQIAVDLERQTARLADGPTHYFEIDSFAKRWLHEGIDELAYTLSQTDRIAAFERQFVDRDG